MAENVSGPNRRYKVGRVLAEYDLLDLHEALPDLWLGEDGEEMSLRELADHINVAILQQAMEAAGAEPLEGEAENAYRLLTDDDVSSAEVTRVQRRLERAGVDVDTLQGDFVTYQAIRGYLQDHRGAEYTPSETDPLEREATNVQKLRGRMVSVVEGNLERLRDGNQLTLGEFQTLADIRVVCEDCNSQFGVLELLDRGGCHCESQN